MIVLTIIALLLLGIAAIVSYRAYILIKQVEALEDEVSFYMGKIDEIREMHLMAQVQLKEIDIRGSFEADDEIGFIFKQIQVISNDLLKTVESIYDGDE
jgi:hypothetical protein